MFNIALTLVLSGDDDGQTVFLAKPVGDTADIVIASLVGMIVLMIRKADCIENQVVMNMIFVYVGGKYKFILAAQDFFCKLHADLMGLLRRHLAGRKGLDEMIPHYAALFTETALCRLHLGIGCFTALTVKDRRKEMLFRFLWICGISNTRIQRSLFSVDSIVYPLIQSVTDGDDLRDGHIRVLSPPAKAFPASP